MSKYLIVLLYLILGVYGAFMWNALNMANFSFLHKLFWDWTWGGMYVYRVWLWVFPILFSILIPYRHYLLREYNLNTGLRYNFTVRNKLILFFIDLCESIFYIEVIAVVPVFLVHHWPTFPWEILFLFLVIIFLVKLYFHRKYFFSKPF